MDPKNHRQMCVFLYLACVLLAVVLRDPVAYFMVAATTLILLIDSYCSGVDQRRLKELEEVEEREKEAKEQ